MDPVPKIEQPGSRAVLVSGGLDSAILLGQLLRTGLHVHPLFVRCGLRWEPAELKHLHRFLSSIARPTLAKLSILDLPVADLYDGHWAITGQGVPDADSADEAVFLPGRNVLLLAKAMLWCYLHQVPAVALAHLAANPFGDASPAFFEQYEKLIHTAVGRNVRVERPFAHLEKKAVLLLGADLPLEKTFSCIDPVGLAHCGRCNKCAERRQAFADSGISDPTSYGVEAPCIA
jgi:7-cyano-7-deazaguanine synthase